LALSASIQFPRRRPLSLSLFRSAAFGGVAVLSSIRGKRERTSAGKSFPRLQQQPTFFLSRSSIQDQWVLFSADASEIEVRAAEEARPGGKRRPRNVQILLTSFNVYFRGRSSLVVDSRWPQPLPSSSTSKGPYIGLLFSLSPPPLSPSFPRQ
jgi:hypothetical protein